MYVNGMIQNLSCYSFIVLVIILATMHLYPKAFCLSLICVNLLGKYVIQVQKYLSGGQTWD